MGVFHFDRLVGNYGFFKGREQCLPSRSGLVVVSWLVAMDRQQTSWEVCRTRRQFTDPRLVSYEISVYIRRIGLHNVLFGIWHLNNYIWQHLR